MGSIRGMELGGQDGDVDYLSTGSSVSGRPSSQVVVDQIPTSSKTCYVSNLAPTSSTTVTDLAALFSRFGSILQLRQGCGSAVIEMSTHEHAATAIAELTSYEFHGQPLKCSWYNAEDDPSVEATNPASSSGYPSTPATPKIPFYTKEDFPAPAALAAARVGHVEKQQLRLDEMRQMMIQAHKLGHDIEQAGYSTYAIACLSRHSRNDKAALATQAGQASPTAGQSANLTFAPQQRKQSSQQKTPSHQSSMKGAGRGSPLRNEMTSAPDDALANQGQGNKTRRLRTDT